MDRRMLLKMMGWMAVSLPFLAKIGEASGEKPKSPKNILVITGSSRVDGNSDMLAKAFAEGAQAAGHAVDIFPAGRKAIQGCRGCGACWTSGKPCVQNDDFEELWPLLEKSDVLVFCSPLYWYAMSGHIKCAIDRLFPYSQKNKPRDLHIKESALLMCGETWFDRGFAGAVESWKKMIGYKGWKDRGIILATRVYEKGDILGKSELEDASKLGRSI